MGQRVSCRLVPLLLNKILADPTGHRRWRINDRGDEFRRGCQWHPNQRWRNVRTENGTGNEELFLGNA